ncbi:hypothetical protein V5O48_017880 [Marasmius crinis-equi]|uniref:Uncharacterized protein n=1 Tax=Marasmius crinis-equi TaxID=585013 RepID=A0ABR3EMR5_9AGAR
MTLALCQRAYLELVARLDWFEKFSARFTNPPSSSPPVANVVGALTGEGDLCERLLRAGIPVWYTHPLDRKHSVRVDTWIDPFFEGPEIALRDSGVVLSLRDETPPHQTVFSGYLGPTQHQHYQAMGRFIRAFSTTNVYLDNVDTSQPTSSQVPAFGPQRSQGKSRKSGSKPYPTKIARTENKDKDASKGPPQRNQFLDVETKYMPPPLLNWMSASEAVGQMFDSSLPAPPNRNNGYALPDPNILVGTKNEAARTWYITTWLKLRPVLLYRMRSTTFEPLRTSEWWSVIGIEAHPTKAEPTVGKMRAKMEDMLKKCLVSGGLEGTISLEDLENAPVRWADKEYRADTMPPLPIVRQILWELFEINFRFELLALDRIYFRGALSPEERQIAVLNMFPHWSSSMIPSDFTAASSGFVHENLDRRRGTLFRLYSVMSHWNGTEGQLPRPLVEGVVRLQQWKTPKISEQEFNELETAYVQHYVSLFATTFRHPTKIARTENKDKDASKGPPQRNKFLDVETEYMPPPLLNWMSASEAVGQMFDSSLPAPPNRNNGYALPDPNILVGTKNEAARTRYITTWLKLRPVLLYRMRSTTFEPLRTSKWRSVIGIEAHPTKAETTVGKMRAKMEDMLKKCLVSGGLELVSSIL